MQLKMLGLLLGVFAAFAAVISISICLFQPPNRQTFVGYLSVLSLISMFASPLFIIVSRSMRTTHDQSVIHRYH